MSTAREDRARLGSSCTVVGRVLVPLESSPPRSPLSVRIVSDTACDLPPEIAERLGVSLVPLHVRFGDREFVDREELSTKEFWRLCSGGDALPETSAPAPGAFQAVFEAAAQDGASGVVCVTLSSRLSATFEAASRAAKEVKGFAVEVVDSRSVTLGEGLVVMAAAAAARGGADVAEVRSVAEATMRRVSVYGAIDTLDNLKRGGRIGGAAAALGTLLSIKPVIAVRDGVVEQESRQRTRAKSLRYMADKLRAAGPLEWLAIMGAEAADFDEFVSLISDVVPQRPRILGDIGPVVGTHAGPGAIGVAWVTAD